MQLTDWMRLSQHNDETLAKKLGVHETSVWRWRTGRRMPSKRLLQAVERLTNGAVTANDFINQKPGPSSLYPRCNRSSPDGVKLKAVRRRLGLTQDEVGAIAGVGNSTVSRWEAGQRGIPEGLIEKLQGSNAAAVVEPRVASAGRAAT